MTQWKYIDGDNRDLVNELGETANVNDAEIQAWLAAGNSIALANSNAGILAQIAVLEEKSQFTRKQREGIIMSASLAALDAQIATLRTQLVR